MQKCMVCGSDKIQPWLGGSIGALYHCASCHYIGPVILGITEARLDDGIEESRKLLRDGTFWSETGIGNRSVFET